MASSYLQINICRLSRNLNNTYLLTCSSREDSDQRAHSCSLTRIFTGGSLDRKGCTLCMRTMRMRRLIWVFVRRTFQRVRFLILRLDYRIRLVSLLVNLKIAYIKGIFTKQGQYCSEFMRIQHKTSLLFLVIPSVCCLCLKHYGQKHLK